MRRLLACALVSLLGVPPVASASYPGANGRIAFVRDGSIFSVTSAGADLRRITDGRNDRGPAYSPDGSRIAFSRNGDVFTVAATGGPVSRVTTAATPEYQPTWSPDGRHIAFVSIRSYVFNVYRVRSRPPYGTAVKMTRNAAVCQRVGSPSWATGGALWYVLTWCRASPRDDPRTQVRLTRRNPNGTENDFGPCSFCAQVDAAPQGRAIAYDPLATTLDGSPLDGWVTKFTPSTGVTAPASPHPGEGEYYREPAWSPSGTMLAYSYTRDSSSTPPKDLYVSRADGTRPTKIAANASDPTWQPLR